MVHVPPCESRDGDKTQFNQGGTLSNPINSPYVRLFSSREPPGKLRRFARTIGGVELDASYRRFLVMA